MKNPIFFALVLGFSSAASYTYSQDNSISDITDNIAKVCDKPGKAGSYWDIKVKGDGAAEIKLKLAKLGLSGEADFTKGEWEGVKSTVENSKDYRDCVKSLSPLFIEKFSPLVRHSGDVNKSPSRVLGGIKWQEFGLGLNMVLDSCGRQGSMVSCNLAVNSNDGDVTFYIYGRSSIYDQNGRKYSPNYVSVANFKAALKDEYSYVKSELVKGVDTNIKIRFSNVPEDASAISKVKIASHVSGKGVNSANDYEFRNVKINLE